jgi:hypothetical protein
MTSYPKVNGAHVDAQPTYLQDILRKEWAYDGLVMSDWGAVSNHVESIKYGYVASRSLPSLSFFFLSFSSFSPPFLLFFLIFFLFSSFFFLFLLLFDILLSCLLK